MLHLADRFAAWRTLWRHGLLIRYAAGRSLVACGISRWFSIRRSGYRLQFSPSALALTLWVNPDDRLEDELLLERYLRPGDTVIDVGANIGSFALPAAVLAGVRGQVVAIEPHPRTFRYLCENARLNGAATLALHNVACGRAAGRVEFSDSRLDDQNRVTSAGRRVEVPMVRLDDLARGLGRVALLKIDVEGYELLVLEGSTALLGRTDAVLFESSEEHYRQYGYATADVLALLQGAGFDMYRVDADGDPEAVPAGYVSSRCENLLALRPTARSRFTRPAVSGSAAVEAVSSRAFAIQEVSAK